MAPKPSPISGYTLTDEDRQKSRESRKKNKEERSKEALDRINGLDHRAISVLEAALDSADETIRVRAAQDLLDRALGKAIQATDLRHTVSTETDRISALEKLNAILEQDEKREPDTGTEG